MKLFLLALAILIFTAPQAEARYPDARCELIRQSVIADLPHFCGSNDVNDIRLIDFGNQLELLEKKCAQPELALKLKKALNERVHRKNKAGCSTLAEQMSFDANKSRASATPDAAF